MDINHIPLWVVIIVILTESQILTSHAGGCFFYIDHCSSTGKYAIHDTDGFITTSKPPYQESYEPEFREFSNIMDLAKWLGSEERDGWTWDVPEYAGNIVLAPKLNDG